MRGRPLRIQWQHSAAELKQRFRQERDLDARMRLQALWLLRQGMSMKQVAEVVGVSYRTVQRWLQWYRHGGLDEMMTRRKGGPGKPRGRLSPEQLALLAAKVRRGELTSVHQARAWVARQWGISYTYAGMWKVLQRLQVLDLITRSR